MLPGKPNSKNILFNDTKLAMIRLNNLSRELVEDPELQKRYDETSSYTESEGVMEDVPSSDNNTYRGGPIHTCTRDTISDVPLCY